jgi:hypothetical protein
MGTGAFALTVPPADLDASAPDETVKGHFTSNSGKLYAAHLTEPAATQLVR